MTSRPMRVCERCQGDYSARGWLIRSPETSKMCSDCENESLAGAVCVGLIRMALAIQGRGKFCDRCGRLDDLLLCGKCQLDIKKWSDPNPAEKRLDALLERLPPIPDRELDPVALDVMLQDEPKQAGLSPIQRTLNEYAKGHEDYDCGNIACPGGDECWGK